MHIGVAGPVDLSLIDMPPSMSAAMPKVYSFPFTAALVNQYRKLGHEVSVFCLGTEIERTQEIHGDGLHIYIGRYRPRARHRLLDGFALERNSIEEFIRRSHCDVVHAHWTYEFALGALQSERPAVITVHDWAPAIVRQFRDVYRLYRMGMQKMVLQRARTLTVPSPYLEKRVIRSIRSRTSLHLVPNGSTVPDHIRTREFSRAGEAPRLLAVLQGFTRNKNAKTLIEAMKSVRQALPSSRLTMVGRGFEPDGPASAWARGHRLDQNILFLGEKHPDEVSTLYANSDLLVHPSLEESFGMVAIEAMSHGLPVVGGVDSGAIPWVLDHGDAGYLCDVSSVDALAAAVVEAWSDEAARRAIQVKGARRVQENFSVEASANRFVEILQGTLDPVRTPTRPTKTGNGRRGVGRG